MKLNLILVDFLKRVNERYIFGIKMCFVIKKVFFVGIVRVVE